MLEFGHAAKVVTPRISFDLRSHALCRVKRPRCFRAAVSDLQAAFRIARPAARPLDPIYRRSWCNAPRIAVGVRGGVDGYCKGDRYFR